MSRTATGSPIRCSPLTYADTVNAGPSLRVRWRASTATYSTWTISLAHHKPSGIPMTRWCCTFFIHILSAMRDGESLRTRNSPGFLPENRGRRSNTWATRNRASCLRRPRGRGPARHAGSLVARLTSRRVQLALDRCQPIHTRHSRGCAHVSSSQGVPNIIETIRIVERQVGAPTSFGFDEINGHLSDIVAFPYETGHLSVAHSTLRIWCAGPSRQAYRHGPHGREPPDSAGADGPVRLPIFSKLRCHDEASKFADLPVEADGGAISTQSPLGVFHPPNHLLIRP